MGDNTSLVSTHFISIENGLPTSETFTSDFSEEKDICNIQIKHS
jgi:hypothetical protein